MHINIVESGRAYQFCLQTTTDCTRDSLLPVVIFVNLKQGARRADIIIVTKCPAGMSAIDMRVIEHEVSPSMYHHVFLKFVYDEPLPVSFAMPTACGC